MDFRIFETTIKKNGSIPDLEEIKNEMKNLFYDFSGVLTIKITLSSEGNSFRGVSNVKQEHEYTLENSRARELFLKWFFEELLGPTFFILSQDRMNLHAKVTQDSRAAATTF